MDFIARNFFLIDIILGLGSFSVIIFLYRSKLIGRYIWILFWIGAGLGFTWEFSCNLQMIFSSYPVARFLKPLPVNFMVLVVVHSLWDGSLFIIGAGLVKLFYKEKFFEKYNFSELLILITWGQFQEILVELASTTSDGWEWIPYWWNPELFLFNGRSVTIFPQLIWLFAVIIFYWIAVKFKHRIAA